MNKSKYEIVKALYQGEMWYNITVDGVYVNGFRDKTDALSYGWWYTNTDKETADGQAVYMGRTSLNLQESALVSGVRRGN